MHRGVHIHAGKITLLNRFVFNFKSNEKLIFIKLLISVEISQLNRHQSQFNA